jgi:RNA polymerase sigma factor (sigma-70 family)
MTEPDRRDAEFAMLYAEHYRAVFRYVLVARGPSDAEDIVAETFQKAFFAWQGGGIVDRPLAWLLTIARRTVIDAVRRDGRRPIQSLGADEPLAPDALEARETWMWFASVTRDLPEPARQALYLRYAAGLSAEEIGLALGISGSGVRSAIGRALAVIRRREQEAEQ